MGSIGQHIKILRDDFVAHEIFLISGSLAYTIAIALAPFLFVILWVAGLLGADIEFGVSKEIDAAMGDRGGEAVRLIMERASHHPSWQGTIGLIGLALLLFSASSIFSQLRKAFDRIDGHPRAKGSFVRQRLLSIGLVIVFAVVTIVSLLGAAFVSGWLPKESTTFGAMLTLVANLLVFSLIFAVFYRIVPSFSPTWSRSWLAGTVAAIFYLIGNFLMGIYLGVAALSNVYGAAASIVVFLLWTYYSSLTLISSYEVARWLGRT